MEDHSFLLAPLEVPPAYAALVQRLRKAVALGLLLPGDRLPSERTLAERLGVSRVTVREALHVLQGAGVVATRGGGSGWTVVSARGNGLAHATSESDLLKTVDAVFELRLAVESMAARLAAQRGAEADVERLMFCQESMEASLDVDEFRRADSRFHLAVAETARNPLLRQAIEDARAAAFAVLDKRPFRVLHESSVAGHARIINAIRDRLPDAAAIAMSEHIDKAHLEVLDALRTSDSATQR